jgi:hypothetical protein
VKRVINFDEEEGYTSGESLSSDDVSHAPPCKKTKKNDSLVPRFEKELSIAVSYNSIGRFKAFLKQYSQDLVLLEDEFFQVINAALVTPYVTHEVIESLFENGFEVSNDDDYIANSLHIANHRNLSQDIKDLLLQNGATISSLGEDSKHRENMTSCRADLLRKNTKQTSVAIAKSAADLTIISHEADSDQDFVKKNPNLLAVFHSQDLRNYISAFAGKNTVLGDELEENQRLFTANKCSTVVQANICQLLQQGSSSFSARVDDKADDKGGQSPVAQFRNLGR